MAFCITWNQKRGEAETPPPAFIQPVEPENRFDCPHCSFIGKSAKSLKIHVTKTHGAP